MPALIILKTESKTKIKSRQATPQYKKKWTLIHRGVFNWYSSWLLLYSHQFYIYFIFFIARAAFVVANVFFCIAVAVELHFFFNWKSIRSTMKKMGFLLVSFIYGTWNKLFFTFFLLLHVYFCIKMLNL